MGVGWVVPLWNPSPCFCPHQLIEMHLIFHTISNLNIKHRLCSHFITRPSCISLFANMSVVINGATVVLAELIVYNRIFYNAWRLLLKVEGPRFRHHNMVFLRVNFFSSRYTQGFGEWGHVRRCNTPPPPPPSIFLKFVGILTKYLGKISRPDVVGKFGVFWHKKTKCRILSMSSTAEIKLLPSMMAFKEVKSDLHRRLW